MLATTTELPAGWIARRRGAAYRFQVRNQGNVELAVNADGAAGGDGPAVTCHPSRLSIPPGGTATITAHVVPAKLVVTGPLSSAHSP